MFKNTSTGKTFSKKIKQNYTEVTACQRLAFIKAQNKTQEYSSFFKNTTQQSNLSNVITTACPMHTRTCRSNTNTKRRCCAEQNRSSRKL